MVLMLSTYSAVGKQTSFCRQSLLQYIRRVEVVCRLEACVVSLKRGGYFDEQIVNFGFKFCQIA